MVVRGIFLDQNFSKALCLRSLPIQFETLLIYLLQSASDLEQTTVLETTYKKDRLEMTVKRKT